MSAGLLQGNCQGFTVRTRRYDAVAKLGIQGARAHLAAAFPDGLALDAAFVAPALVAQVGRRAQGRRERSLDTLSPPGIMLAAPPVSLLSTLCARTPMVSVVRCCLRVRSSARCRPCSRAGCGPELTHWRSHGWV